MTAHVKRIKIFGEGILARSPVITRQRRLNCYLEVRKDGDKSSIVCVGTPGLKLAFNVSTPQQQPARGLIGNASSLYEVAGNQFLSVSSSGQTLAAGSIGTSTGNVGLALNPTQVLIVDGSAGYCYTIATGIITVVGGGFPNGAKTCVYCNGFFLAELPGTNQFFVSNYADGTIWSGLAFAAAVQYADGILAVDQLGGIAIIFSSGHCEFWQNQGSTPEPFVYIQNSAQEFGLAAVYGRAHAADALYFLAQTREGGLKICRIRGYAVQPVSTVDIDQILQAALKSAGTVADCVALAYQDSGHTFVQFTLPTANRSLLFDTTMELWGETQTGITQGYAARHIGQFGAFAYGSTYVSDYSSGNVYTFDPKVYTDNGNMILRELVSRCALEDFNIFSASEVYLDMRTGVGLASPSAQGYNPLVGLSIAKDNRNFGAERLIPLGAQGQYTQRVSARRWGRMRMGNLRVRLTDPVPFEITAGAMRTRSRAGRQAPSTRGAA